MLTTIACPKHGPSSFRSSFDSLNSTPTYATMSIKDVGVNDRSRLCFHFQSVTGPPIETHYLAVSTGVVQYDTGTKKPTTQIFRPQLDQPVAAVNGCHWLQGPLTLLGHQGSRSNTTHVKVYLGS